jgi:outer membrane murein-binding lipoprotein Lpp
VKRVAAAVVVLVTLAGCGSHAEVDARASRDLRSRVDAIRTATDAGDVEGAQALLGQLERAVARWQRRGDLSPDRANQILDAASGVATELDAAAATTSPSVSPSPSAESKRPKPPKGDEAGPGKSEKAPGHEGD